MLDALIARLALDGIDQETLDLGPYDGATHPLPFPELHWEIACCWMLVDGTLPAPIQLKNGQLFEYQASLLRDPSSITRWRKRLDYARTGFRLR